MERLIKFNSAQLTSFLLHYKNKVDIWGRGDGKSYGIGSSLHLNVMFMPRGLTIITGQSYTQLLTRTLPSTFKFLASQMGYVQDVHYKIRNKPEKHWKSSLEKIMKYDNAIPFINGHVVLLASQDKPGSGRGPNADFEIVDEALTILKHRYDEEISPTNRGNDEIFGLKSKQPVPWHHGFHYSSSMPFSQQAKWLLNIGDYYEEEAGIQIFQLWNKVVKMQLDLLEIDNPKDFAAQWNEIVRVRRQISPFVSKKGTLFTLSNAFDNLDNVGLSYIRREYEKQTRLLFLIEIMNMLLDKVEDCYYDIVEERHVYYNADNEGYVLDIADDTNNDLEKLSNRNSLFDADCNSNEALEVVFDWGATISLMSVGQERNWDFVYNEFAHTDNTINEFFVKPDPKNENVMIDALVDQFCNYYRFHREKTVIYFRDRHGDKRLANSSQTYNQQAMERFAYHKWIVIEKVHRGEEPPQHDKYLLWGNILKEKNPKFPKKRFNGSNCKYTLISMNNTQVVEKDNKFKKDKRSENPSSGVLPEEATHFGDAVDKRIWTKYGELLTSDSSFVPNKY